jgi:hypothetical protein
VRRREHRLAWLATVCLLAVATPARAQGPSAPSWLTLETSADVDRAIDETGTSTGGAIFDAYISVRLARGLEIVTRPWAQRQANGEWNRQIWLGALRYEHKGPIGVRVEAGLISPPVGFANLSLRPHLNPTVSQPSALFQGLPAPEPFAPRITLLGAVYPMGVSATVSGTHWDARSLATPTRRDSATSSWAAASPPWWACASAGR